MSPLLNRPAEISILRQYCCMSLLKIRCKRKKANLLFYFLCICQLYLTAQSQDNVPGPILLSPDNDYFSINESIYYFEDEKSNLSFEEISQPVFSDQFLTSSKRSLNFGYTNSTYWVKLDLGDKGIWFRLFAGYFQTREEADEFIRTRKIKGAESRRIKYANLIGFYTSKEEIEKQKAILEKQGYSPYIINDTEKNFRLFVGAFYQRVRAEKQNSHLANNGIHSQLVER